MLEGRNSPEAAQLDRLRQWEGRSRRSRSVAGGLLGGGWGQGLRRQQGFAPADTDFLGLHRPRAPSHHRGIDAHTGVHKMEPRCGCHAASITGKLYFPTVARSPPRPPSHSSGIIGVSPSHTEPRSASVMIPPAPARVCCSHKVPDVTHTCMCVMRPCSCRGSQKPQKVPPKLHACMQPRDSSEKR